MSEGDVIHAKVTREPDDINGRLIESLREYAVTKMGEKAAHEAFDGALASHGLTRARATDPLEWVPLAVLHSVADAFRLRLGRTFITDAFTWAVPVRRDFSAMSLSALASPDFLFRRIDRARTFFARHVHFTVENAARGELQVRLDYRDGLPRREDSCHVALGVLHSVPMLFDLPPSRIEQTSCYALGDSACSYVVRYRSEPRFAGYGALAGAAVAVAGYFVVVQTPAWLVAIAIGWLVGREIRMTRLRRHMTRVSEEHRRVLGEHEIAFQRRFEEIAELNEQLEARVAARTAELTAAMSALRKANAELRRTIDEMQTLHAHVVDAGVRDILGRAVEELAHEIRNPMTILLANAQLLEDDQASPDLREISSVARDIRGGVDRMRAVMNWFIQLHENDDHATPSSLDDQIEQVVGHQRKTTFADRITVSLDLEPLTILAHGQQLMQVFENLFTNAARAMVTGTIEVTARRIGARAVVTVKDSGPGISREHLPHIFERGFTTKRGSGSGLGLYITRAIVERHGGSIAATSEPGHGATFQIELPLLDEAHSELKSAPARPSV